MVYTHFPEKPIEITDELKDALALLEAPAEQHPLIFITGKAGTGKTTLLRFFAQNTPKEAIVLATTGLAAIQIHGQTVHSFFHLKPQLNLLDVDNLKKLPRRVVDKLETIIVDEASMLRADVLDAMDHILRQSAHDKRPFGGKQLILFGDLFQLPPIEEERDSGLFDLFHTYYQSPYFFDARVVSKTRIEVFELTRIFRQAEDRGFALLLNKIRENKITQPALDAWLNKKIDLREPTDQENTIILSPTNIGASGRNQYRLAQLPGEEFVYPAQIDGDFKRKNAPAESNLRLKRGAKIMMLNNDINDYWVNGDIGTVYELGPDFIKVVLKGCVYQVEPHVWEDIRYEFNPITQRLEPVVKGFFKQYPLKLAWAITIHKSQGLTFDNIYLDIGNGAFAPGQTYVALSRCRSLQGVKLKKPISQKDIRCDGRVVQFFNKVYGH